MRVLHLAKTSVGAAWALRQMRELVALGVDVHVALPGPGPRVAEYEAAGVVTHPVRTDLPVRTPWRVPASFRALRELVADVRPDLIHSHFVGTTLAMRLALGRRHAIPRVFQVPGPLHLEHAPFRQVDLATAGHRDYWIGSCRWTCDRYRDAGVPPERVFLSYYGTDVSHYVRRPAGALRKEIGVGPETKLVGMVAFMYPPKRYLGQRRGLKGHEDLIDALVICARSRADLLGVFVGGAWNGAAGYERRIRNHAARHLGRRAVFLGTRSDVTDAYADFDVVAHPSHSENVGGAAESLLLAVPTIATNVGGFPDVVVPGRTGWLVPPKSPARLADAIATALDSPDEARRLAENGRELTAHLFDVRRTAAEVLDIYRRILGPS